MTELTASDVEELLRAAPYHRWLDVRVVELTKDRIELTASWREEWIGNPESHATHGGILASLLGWLINIALTAGERRLLHWDAANRDAANRGAANRGAR
ncbi:PaaI family thioesterase [Saccharopolyspora pogona]|uniref:PaaI family thioesterase n=1 Tax=Saccharopolyspora pogona TaxID=333966 RepID=UPI001688A132|nr:hypothetical protein [Saccharopolyspora pogona]